MPYQPGPGSEMGSEYPLIVAAIRHPGLRRYAERTHSVLRDRLGELAIPRRLQRTVVAAHEAGHTVVMAALGLPLHELRLWRERGRWRGKSVTRETAIKTDIAAVLTRMVVAVAGNAGERLLVGSTHTGAHELGYALAGSEAICGEYGIPAMTAMLATLRLVDECLAANAELARRLHRQLLRRRTLSEPALERLLRGVVPLSIERWPQLALEPGTGEHALESVLHSIPAFDPQADEHRLVAASDCAEDSSAELPTGALPRMLPRELADARAAGAVVEQHEKVVLQFSGGKDSLATLYLLRPWWDRLTVLWCDSGAAFPEVREQMQAVKAMVPHFVTVTGDQPQHIALMGFPVDVVPVRNTAVGKMFQRNDDVVLQSSWECCAASLWLPMHRAVVEMGATLVIRGQRSGEGRKAPISSGQAYEGVTCNFPIEHWTTEQVLDFLRRQGVELPAYYEHTRSSIDCWDCTAYLDEQLGRMRYMRERHPQMWEEVKTRLALVDKAIRFELGHVEAALASAAPENRDSAPIGLPRPIHRKLSENDPDNLRAHETFIADISSLALARGHRLLQIYRLAADDREHVAQLLELMRPSAGAHIIDMGCGVGEVARIMAELSPGLRFTLVNSNRWQLDQCPEHFARVHVDFHDTGLPDACADVVMFCYSIGFADLPVAMREARRLLKPGGILFLWDFVGASPLMREAWDYSTYEPADMLTAAQGAGFVLDEQTEPTDTSCDGFMRLASERGVREMCERIVRQVHPRAWRFLALPQQRLEHGGMRDGR